MERRVSLGNTLVKLTGSGTTWCLRYSLSFISIALRSRAWLLITLIYHRMESYIPNCQLSKQENLHVQIFVEHRIYNLSQFISPLLLSKFYFYPVSRTTFHIAFPTGVIIPSQHISCFLWIDFYNFSCQSAREFAPPHILQVSFLKTNVDYETLF